MEIITCESGDWEVIKIDDEIIFEGHSIPNCIWIHILKNHCKLDVEEIQISDEDMEYGNY